MKKSIYSLITIALFAFLFQGAAGAKNPDSGIEKYRYDRVENVITPEKDLIGDNLKNSRAEYIQAGAEYFTVTCGQIVFGDNGLYPPLPPDFFGPGSEPFTGTISLVGANSNGTTYPVPDAQINRLGDIFFNEPLPDEQTVPVEIIQLDLKSEEPVGVNIGGVDSFFDVFMHVELPDPDNSSQSILQENETGGTSHGMVSFFPVFTFTEVGNPSNQIMWSPYDMGFEPATFTQPDPYGWTHSPVPNSFDLLGDGFMVFTSGSNNTLNLMPLLQRTDDFMVGINEDGFPENFGGSGFNEGKWFEYPNYGWWNVWFYDHPVDVSRSKKIKANMMLEPRNPDFPTQVEIVWNWSTPQWPGYPEMNRPPLPSDVPTPDIEDGLIGRSEAVFVWEGLLQEPIPLDNIEFEIPDFNPEWLSVDIRGFNYVLSGNIIHTCFKPETCPDPTQLPTGLILLVGEKFNPEPWNAWIGGYDGTTQVQLFADDPDNQIAKVNFFISMPGTRDWIMFDSDDNGYSYSAPGDGTPPEEETDGWSGYLIHEMITEPHVPLGFKAEVETVEGEILEVFYEGEITFDNTPPDSFEQNIEDGFITDEDEILLDVMPNLADISYIEVQETEKDSVYQKNTPTNQQPDSMSCGPTALASCLQYFANHGYPLVTGGLSSGALIDSLKKYVKYDPAKGTDISDMANGARQWIEKNGGGFTVSRPYRFGEFNTTRMRNELEAEGLIRGISQNVITLFRWPAPPNDTHGHFMTLNSVHNTPENGKRKFDFMDPATDRIVWGEINENTGEVSGFTFEDGTPYPFNGGVAAYNLMICPTEPASNPGTGTIAQGPDPEPVPVPVEEPGKRVIRTTAVDQNGNKARKDIVITKVTKASCPDTTVGVGGPPFVPQGANPPGGTFNGPGFIDSLFFPTDTGYFPATYSYTYDNGFTSVGDFIIRVVGIDFGDAPDDPYPTLLANNGARHMIDNIAYMGNTVDGELDGQPTTPADGDDLANYDDEDGVAFLTTLVPGKPAQVRVNASVNGGLSAWLDFNGNGSWADPGEQIFTDEMLSAGDNTLTFLVPTQAATGSTYARFRFSTQQSGLSWTGLAENGEVEDYMVEIIENQSIKWIQYPDTEFYGYHANQQEGPDLYVADDWKCEGGRVTDLHWWGYYEMPNSGPCAGFRITLYENDASGSYSKPGAMIMTRDAPFGTNPGEVGEYFTGNSAITGDMLYYYYFVLPEPFAQIEGNIYWLELMALSADAQNNVLWEWQTNGNPIVLNNPIQRDDAGYETQLDRNMAFIITSEPDVGDNYDFGDAPDQPYPTLLANNGARHFIDGQTYLGNAIDAEPDGQPNIPANGDDLNNVYDEDGVTFIEPFVAGQTAKFKVVASGDGYLNTWIDLNQNGSWGEAPEHIFVDAPLSAGINTLTYDIPAGVKPGATYIRFRFDSYGGLSYYGDAQNGEVEDYRLIVYPPDWGYTPTGSSHIISIPATTTFNCVSLSTGDFMGTFFTDENGNTVCGGVAWWDGINNQTLVAFGDDMTTPSIKEGFGENEPFTWKVYYSASGMEEEVLVNYNPALPQSDGKFHDNGISALTSVVKRMSVTATATPNPVCLGDSVFLGAVISGGCGSNTNTWTSDPAGFISSDQNPVATPTITTTYFVTVTNPWGDSATDSVTVVVNDPPLVTCPDDFAVCMGDGPVTLSGGIPAGGTYSGTGVTSEIFYPSVVGPGTYTITYSYTNPNTGCSAECSFQVTVNSLPQMDCPPSMEACEGDPLVLLNSSYPLGGESTGTGVSFDGTDYWFDPGIGPGAYLINYCYTDPDTGCEGCCEFNFYVYEKPEVLCPEDFTICIDTSPFTLTGGIPVGGTYSGTGVSGGMFDPAAAGPGDHVITYTYVDSQTFCENFCTFTITVIEVQVTCPDDIVMCANEGTIILSGGLPAGGTYSGLGVSGGTFTPPSPFGGSYVITYTYVEPGTNCSGSCEFYITVNPIPVMDCPPYMEVCEDDLPVLLGSAFPLGGDYSGTGVTWDGADYWFDPSVGPGSYLITYCYTDPVTECQGCCEFNFYVYEKPEVLCPEDVTICIDTSPFILSGATPTGGIYSGISVSFDGTDYWFDPADAGAGDHLITYTYVDPQTNCEGFCTFTITVIEVEVICPENMVACIGDPAITLTGATPSGGTYSGTGVSGGVFDPSTAGVGTHTITYIYVEPGTNCSASCEFEIEVFPQPQVDCPPFMEACEDDPPVLLLSSYPMGGIYSGPGVYFDGLDYYFDPGVGAGTYLINYCYTDPDTGCDGCCEFNFYVYPKPYVECPDDFAVCIDTPAFTLTGATPAGGTYSGAGVSGGVFDPVVAGVGSHSIMYFYSDPQTGCSNFCTFNITVIELPQVVCPDDMEVCVDTDPFLLTGATPAGGTYSGPGVTGGMFYPLTAGTGSHIITYTLGVPGTNCYAECEFIITVKSLPQMDCPPYMEACEDDPPVLLNSSYPLGGEYTGVGVSFDGTDYWFDPAAGPGTYLINYCYTDPDTGCENCCEFNFYVYEKPEVLCPEDFTICIDTSPFTLSGGIPVGGTYSGTGVSGGMFDPAVVGAGDHMITYTYVDPQTNCEGFCTFVITVIEVEVVCPDDMAVCLNDGLTTLTGASPVGGNFTGPGVSGNVFDPIAAGVGVHTITYTYVEPGTNCFGSCEFTIEVYPLPQVDCPADMEVCLYSSTILLPDAYPAGGVYSGDGVFFDGGFYYFDPSVGLGEHEISYCVTNPDTGCENCCTFIIKVVADHIIDINAGWSGISSYIEPGNTNMDNVIYPLTYQLIIMQDLQQVYWPGGNVFTLDTWNPYSGYAIKVSENTQLPICGAEVMDKTVELSQGWNIIPVLSPEPVAIEDLFAGVEGLELAKEVAGTGVYWTEYGINGIGNVMPGSAYYVKMGAPGSITFDGNPVATVSATATKPLGSTPWNEVISVPGSHVVLFNVPGSAFETGDIIGGFTADGRCAGATEVDKNDQPFTLSLNGDDPVSEIVEGFEPMEALSYRLYRQATGETFELLVSYDAGLSSGNFEINGTSEITGVKMSATGMVEKLNTALKIYPNPSGGIFHIEGLSDHITVSIFNAYGEEIISGYPVSAETIDLSNQPNGVYFVRIHTEQGAFMKKLVKE